MRCFAAILVVTVAAACAEQAAVPAPARANSPVVATAGEPETTSRPPQEHRRNPTLDEWRVRMQRLTPGSRESEAAVPGLVALIRDRSVPWFTRRQAALTLARVGLGGSDVVPVLIELLDEESSPEESTRLWAAKALSLYGAESKAAAPRLVGILRDETLPVGERLAAVEALGRIGTSHTATIPALIEALKQEGSGPAAKETEKIPQAAAESLGYIGPPAATAVPALIRAARGRDEVLRRNAAAALGAMGGSADVALPVLVEQLVFDESAYVRDAATTALAGIGPTAVAVLGHLLADDDVEVRWRAASSLGQIGPDASEAVPGLTTALEDESPLVRLAAAEALWSINKESQSLLPVLLGALTNEDRQIRIRAVRLLIGLGEQAAAAVEPLRRMQGDERADVRRAAEEVLEHLEKR